MFVRKILFTVLSALTLAACGGSPTGGSNNGGGDTLVDAGSDILSDSQSDVGGDSDSGMDKEEFCRFCRQKGLECPDTMPSPSTLTENDCIDPDQPGTLKVKAETTADSPSIFIDESDTGKDAPAEFEKEPGTYTVRLESDWHIMRSDLIAEKDGKQVEVKPGQESEVQIPMYPDGRGTWQSQEDPDKKPVVEMHTDSLSHGEECESDVYLYNVDDAEVSYCLYPDDTFNLCSRQEPCASGFWWRGSFQNPNKISLTTCNTNQGCFQPEVFKKISD